MSADIEPDAKQVLSRGDVERLKIGISKGAIRDNVFWDGDGMAMKSICFPAADKT